MQMTLREQLEDPIYKKWFKLEPREYSDGMLTPPWIVYVQFKQDGPWSRAQFKSWKAGYKYVKKMLKDRAVHDIALTHKRHCYRPPVVRRLGKRSYHLPGALSGEIWCGYCRRMTRFTYFKTHHAFPKKRVNSGDRRCSICGIRLEAITRFH
jgi:hypothetical protein